MFVSRTYFTGKPNSFPSYVFYYYSCELIKICHKQLISLHQKWTFINIKCIGYIYICIYTVQVYIYTSSSMTWNTRDLQELTLTADQLPVSSQNLVARPTIHDIILKTHPLIHIIPEVLVPPGQGWVEVVFAFVGGHKTFQLESTSFTHPPTIVSSKNYNFINYTPCMGLT